MISRDVAEKLRYFDLKLARMATDIVSGQYASRFRGHGIEFDEVREYVPGDDVRTIDWHVSARMGKPFVKIFREERDLTVYLVIDASASMLYGSMEKNKWALQTDLAGTLAYLGILNHDRVGLLRFGQSQSGQQPDLLLPPKRGRAHLVRLLAGIIAPELSNQGRKTQKELGRGPLSETLHTLLKIAKRRSVVVVMSDFYGEDFELPLSLVAKAHDLKVMRVSDPLEQMLPKAGIVTLRDAETGALRQVNSTSKYFRQNMHLHDQARDAQLQNLCSRLGVRYARFICGQPVFHALVDFLRYSTAQKRG